MMLIIQITKFKFHRYQMEAVLPNLMLAKVTRYNNYGILHDNTCCACVVCIMLCVCVCVCVCACVHACVCVYTVSSLDEVATAILSEGNFQQLHRPIQQTMDHLI